jgi:two-component system, NarL family, sensor kinase
MIMLSTDRPTGEDVAVPERLTITDLVVSPELFRLLLGHAYRGIRVQFVLRLFLVIFMICAIAAVPPAHDRAASWVIVASYVVWAVGVGLWTSNGGVGPVRWMWVALLVDTLALAALTAVAGASAEQSWTADLLVNGFFIVPALAATQLRPWVGALVSGPAVVAYLAVSIATKDANTEPWGSILVRTLALVGLAVGCTALSWVQLSRVLDIASLAQERAGLLDELLTLESRERSALAEQLHDGALQYVLAARHDLEDAQLDGDATAFARVDRALTESATLLRSTVTQLHPAVLEQAGLPRALNDLVTSLAERADLLAEVDVTGWPVSRSSVDGLLYSTARELLTNVAKHAQATSVRVKLDASGDQAQLAIIDDGRGVTPDAPQQRLAEGHIGLASLRTRVAAAGGSLDLESAPGAGTTVTVRVPYAAAAS